MKLDDAQRLDLNRQRQIEAQKQSINRLLEARESEADDAKLIQDLTNALTEERQEVLALQHRLNAIREAANDAVAQGHNNVFIDRIVEVLGG